MFGTGLEAVTVVHPDGTRALRGVDLWAAEGELLVVLGPSGSGKTTVLRAIAGLTNVSRGSVWIGGRDVTALPPNARDVAMVFETSALVPFLDVADNMGWGLRARHVPETQVQERVLQQARGLRLVRLLSRKPASLSAGERERVGIGRALVREPSVFLFDEPLAHLDAAERPRLRRRISSLAKDLGAATIYVTHDQVDAMSIADRVVLLNAGLVEQVGTPRELYDRPDNLFVAGFVGTSPIGLLPARLIASSGQAGFRVGARTLPLWASVPKPLRHVVDNPVVLGLRWHDVSDAQRDADPRLVTLPATVVGIERTGSEVIVTAEVAAPPVIAPGADSRAGRGAAVLHAGFPSTTRVRVGDAVQLAVDAARAHVFDSRTGRALLHPTV